MSEPNTISGLQSALRASALQGKVIANNIANLNTPGFRRSELDFQRALSMAMASPRALEPAELARAIIQPRSTPVDAKGNDVSLDKEVGEMIKNSAAYKTYMRILRKLYSQMEFAIKGE